MKNPREERLLLQSPTTGHGSGTSVRHHHARHLLARSFSCLVAFGAVFFLALVFFTTFTSIKHVSKLTEGLQDLRGMVQFQLERQHQMMAVEMMKLMKITEEAKVVANKAVKHERKMGMLSGIGGTRSVPVVQCAYGLATPLIPRKNEQNMEMKYWPELFEQIPEDVFQVIAVMNRQETAVNSSLITKVFQPSRLVLDPPEFDEAVLMRPTDGGENARINSRNVLDFVRLVRYVSDQCPYVLWLEDDALPSSDYWYDRLQELTPKEPDSWLAYWLSNDGSAVLINSRYADFLIQFLVHRFDHATLGSLLAEAGQILKKKKEVLKFPTNNGTQLFERRK